MSSVITDAIVLRHADYGETDRMVTLLSPGLGLLSVAVRGCRRAKSRNLPGTEIFASGEYVLDQKGERYTLTSFQAQEAFFPLREDMTRLAHGAYWLGLVEGASQPDQDATRLYKMLLLSLAVLAYSEVPPRPLTAVFLVQFSMLMGFAPMLTGCVRCGQEPRAPLRFDPDEGGVRCAACGGWGLALSEQSLAWLREAQAKGAFILAGRRALPIADMPEAAEEPFALMRAHVERRVEKHIQAAKFL